MIFALVIREDGLNCHLLCCQGGSVFPVAIAIDDSEPMVENLAMGFQAPLVASLATATERTGRG